MGSGISRQGIACRMENAMCNVMAELTSVLPFIIFQ